jgi:hypothetical protein
MQYRGLIGALTLCTAFCFAMAGARAFDESKYPDWKGKWETIGRPTWLQPGDVGAPLTPEYEKLFEWNRGQQRVGNPGFEPSWACLPGGMPRVMNAFAPMEIVITPATTHILISHIHDNRRIFTDGRQWPDEIEPTFHGYSIGRWSDTDGDGRYDTLDVETRGIKGPRAYDGSGLPLHADNQTVVKETIYLDPSNAKVLIDDITTIDHALARPWTVKKRYGRGPDPRPDWIEQICPEANPHVRIQGEPYFIGADGRLMPSMKDQPPPDLRYFKQPRR